MKPRSPKGAGKQKFEEAAISSLKNFITTNKRIVCCCLTEDNFCCNSSSQCFTNVSEKLQKLLFLLSCTSYNMEYIFLIHIFRYNIYIVKSKLGNIFHILYEVPCVNYYKTSNIVPLLGKTSRCLSQNNQQILRKLKDK